jgi:hypothetical protein
MSKGSLSRAPMPVAGASASDKPADPWERIGWRLVALWAILIIIVSIWVALEKARHSVVAFANGLVLLAKGCTYS